MRMEAEMEKTDKPWGYEEWIEINDNYVVKRLFMKKGNKCSLQYHQKKKETVMILKGTITLILNNQKKIMKPFDVITIDPGDVHRMYAESDDCLYMECSTVELDDVVRIEDEYGRAK